MAVDDDADPPRLPSGRYPPGRSGNPRGRPPRPPLPSLAGAIEAEIGQHAARSALISALSDPKASAATRVAAARALAALRPPDSPGRARGGCSADRIAAYERGELDVRQLSDAELAAMLARYGRAAG